MMKKIGILGGLAWPSTVEYYAGICRLAEAHHVAGRRSGVAEMPEIAIESLDVAAAISLLGKEHDDASWSAFDSYHRDALRRLERSGAEFAVIACNTAHHRFAQITRGICMPVLNIVGVAARACGQLGVNRLLILGTEPVMRSAVIRDAFAQEGVDVAAPYDRQERRAIAFTIQTLRDGRIGSAPECIRAIVAGSGARRMKGSMAVYLGCTELPLAFPAYKHIGVFEVDGIRYVNSTALHIQAAFDYAMAESATAASSAQAEPHRFSAGVATARNTGDTRGRDP